MPPRIAIFLPSLIGGGAERSALFVARALEDAGYAVDVVVSVVKGALTDDPFARAHLVDLRATNELLALPAYRRYLRRVRPALVISFVHSANFISGLAARHDGTPFIVSVRNTLDRAPRDTWWVRCVFGYAPERRLYARAARIHTLSRSLADQVRRRFGTSLERIVVTASAVTPANTRSSPPAPEALALAPFLVSAGRLAPIKGFDTLIRAHAAAASPLPLVILGDGPERARLESLAVSLGTPVIFAGYRDPIAPWLAHARGFVFASRGEGLPRVVIEALHAGLPIVATRSKGGIAELLGDGAFGRLVPVGDEAALAAGIRDLAADAVPAPDVDALSAHLAQFQPAAVAAAYVAMVRDVLAEVDRG